jgi:hypothetical protein
MKPVSSSEKDDFLNHESDQALIFSASENFRLSSSQDAINVRSCWNRAMPRVGIGCDGTARLCGQSYAARVEFVVGDLFTWGVAICVVPVPPALRRVFPLPLAPERRHVEVAPGPARTGLRPTIQAALD